MPNGTRNIPLTDPFLVPLPDCMTQGGKDDEGVNPTCWIHFIVTSVQQKDAMERKGMEGVKV